MVLGRRFYAADEAGSAGSVGGTRSGGTASR